MKLCIVTRTRTCVIWKPVSPRCEFPIGSTWSRTSGILVLAHFSFLSPHPQQQQHAYSAVSLPMNVHWIRKDPKVVADWQSQRGIANNDIVPQACAAEKEYRLAMRKVADLQADISKCQQALRPNSNRTTDQEKESIQERLKSYKVQKVGLQQEFQAAQQRWHNQWIRLASPVDSTLYQAIRDGIDENIQPIPLHCSIGRPIESSISIKHLDESVIAALQDSWMAAAIPHGTSQSILLGQWIHTVDPLILSSKSNLDHLHDIWGCRDPCPICSTGISAQPSNSTFPLFVSVCADKPKGRHLWGEKQLPQMAWLRSSSNDELLILTPASLWDARQVQLQWLQKVRQWLQGLLFQCMSGKASAEGTFLETTLVDPQYLQLHEQSRFQVGSNPLLLAEISNWGDAAPRAMQWQCSGGGTAQQTDYVYLVTIAIHFSEITAWIMKEASFNSAESVASNIKEFPYRRHWSHFDSFGLQHAKQATSKAKHKKVPAYSLFVRVPRHEAFLTEDFASIPIKERVLAEAMTSPFPFLFPSLTNT